MSSRPSHGIHRVGWLSLALLAAGLTGCSSLNLPQFSIFSLKEPPPEYKGVQPSFEMSGNHTEEIYRKVKQARAQNSIVLQVVGDEEPARILPLPPGQKSVFVSNLLRDTGVQKKLGSMDATLFRHTPETIGGIRMQVMMDSKKENVKPESDYALRAGDRLRVVKATNPQVGNLLKSLIGL